MILRRRSLQDRMFMKSLARAGAGGDGPSRKSSSPAQEVQQEQLGDLKLYRVPERTTLASRQSKQVRLMDQSGIPVDTIYGADLGEDTADSLRPRHIACCAPKTRSRITWACRCRQARSRYSAAHRGERLLEHESGLRDIAVDEEVEIDMGESSDVQVSATREKTQRRLEHSQAAAAGAGGGVARG